MALTAAERAKRYRDNKKKNADTHAAYLQERENINKRKAQGEYNFKNKTKRDMNLLRRKWSNSKRIERSKKKVTKAGIDFMNQNTPESSPVRNVENNRHRKPRKY